MAFGYKWYFVSCELFIAMFLNLTVQLFNFWPYIFGLLCTLTDKSMNGLH
jgi:hypothetical protein